MLAGSVYRPIVLKPCAGCSIRLRSPSHVGPGERVCDRLFHRHLQPRCPCGIGSASVRVSPDWPQITIQVYGVSRPEFCSCNLPELFGSAGQLEAALPITGESGNACEILNSLRNAPFMFQFDE